MKKVVKKPVKKYAAGGEGIKIKNSTPSGTIAQAAGSIKSAMDNKKAVAKPAGSTSGKPNTLNAMKKGGTVKKYQNGGFNDDKSRGEQRLDNRINRNKYKLAQAQKELNTTAPDVKDLYRSTPGKSEMLENYIEKKTKRVQKLEDKKARKYPAKTYVAKTGGSVKRKK